MDDAKPNTVSFQERQLLEDLNSGSDKTAETARQMLSNGVTVAVQQAAGSVLYFSELGAFEDWLAAGRERPAN